MEKEVEISSSSLARGLHNMWIGTNMKHFMHISSFLLVVVCISAQVQTMNKDGLPANGSAPLCETTHRNHPLRDRDGEFLLDTTVFYSSRYGRQLSGSIAYDGTNYLVVWYYKRGGVDGYPSYILGTRVTSSGVILDSASIIIATIGAAPPNRALPSVAFDGTNYLVIWLDYRNKYDICGKRINP